ncbi:MAG: COX15/CtaA family protein [Pseudomonadota bacterium]|nr:COX15/CtaA family protein [Pseudomonadota bacterium]
MRPQHRLFWFRRLAFAAALLAAAVIVLGAWVRLTDAGLGCPDWPGCYGHIYPQASHAGSHAGFQLGKALHEMIHRYFATTLGILIVALLIWAVRFRKDPDQPLLPVALLFGVICLQGALGALTVSLLLKPLIVTLHLFGGLSTLALLCWLSQTPQTRQPTASEIALRKYAVGALVALLIQIGLGGWTSTNYAAVACPDFPTCQNSWWPRMDFRDAFVLWRGLGIDYQGGVLANPARVAIHFTHRLGALIAGSILIGVAMLTLARARSRRLTYAGALLSVAVLLQISLGVATVHWGVPLALATAHNAGAALLVVSMVTLLRALWPASSIGMVPLPRVDPPR